ncbi:hypothetical protein JW823_06550 [bacterium]|nr:hypothetical protein [candidate division CSSED10-310 bacterium]
MRNWSKGLSVIIVIALFFLSTGCGTKAPEATPATKDTTGKEPIKAKQIAELSRKNAMQADKKIAANVTADKISASSEKRPDSKQTVNVYKKTAAMDWTITPERRAAIETAIPEAKGFIDGTDIVKAIIDGNIVKKEERIAIFKDKANGKYIYLAAQTNPNPFNDNASLNLIFKEGAFGPDFIMVQLTAPKGFDSKKYLELYGGTGYVTAFVGKLSAETDLVLDPVYDVYLSGYLK